MAPWRRRTSTSAAVVDSFWAIATYTQMTPVPFWLRIVSMAMAVLPVLRSPMISSRWPRPIGVMASIDLIPVWSGSSTGCRSAIPGAGDSSAQVRSVAIGPCSSIGSPSPLTTRPIIASPTGTRSSAPVAVTVSPSSIPVYSPRIITPTDDSSRFSAIPLTPFSNATISPAIKPERP